MTRVVLALLLVGFSLLAAPTYAAPSPSAPREEQVSIKGMPSGTQTVATASDGETRAEYSYNDRGRGENIIATWKLGRCRRTHRVFRKRQ